MRVVLTLLAFSLCLWAPSPADAAFEDGNDLYEKCTATTDFGLYFCFGYIIGANDGAEFEAALKNEKAFCEPDGVTTGQVKDIVVEWLKTNPAYRHLNAGAIVRIALRDAFPCP